MKLIYTPLITFRAPFQEAPNEVSSPSHLSTWSFVLYTHVQTRYIHIYIHSVMRIYDVTYVILYERENVV